MPRSEEVFQLLPSGPTGYLIAWLIGFWRATRAAVAAAVLLTMLSPGNAAATPYTVEVRTGDRNHAGTDAAVRIRLIGAVGGTVERLLDNPGRDDNERGQTCVFHINEPSVGWIQQVFLTHDNKGKNPGWFVEYVKVTDDSLGLQFTAEFHRWLATGEADGLLQATANVNRSSVLVNSEGQIRSEYMGHRVFRDDNRQGDAPSETEQTFSSRTLVGLSADRETALTTSSGLKVGAEFFGLSCDVTDDVEQTARRELHAQELHEEEYVLTHKNTTQPYSAVTVIQILYQDVKVREAHTQDIRMNTTERLPMRSDLITVPSVMTDPEVASTVAAYLTELSDAPLPSPIPLHHVIQQRQLPRQGIAYHVPQLTQDIVGRLSLGAVLTQEPRVQRIRRRVPLQAVPLEPVHPGVR